jgi:hypothetical protein
MGWVFNYIKKRKRQGKRRRNVDTHQIMEQQRRKEKRLSINFWPNSLRHYNFSKSHKLLVAIFCVLGCGDLGQDVELAPLGQAGVVFGDLDLGADHVDVQAGDVLALLDAA